MIKKKKTNRGAVAFMKELKVDSPHKTAKLNAWEICRQGNSELINIKFKDGGPDPFKKMKDRPSRLLHENTPM
jgi:hypothetical protein